MSARNLPVDAARIAADIEALAEITEPGRPYTRRAFSPLFLKGRAYIEARMKAAGLETRIDAGGNLIGRRPGKNPARGTIMLGSHSDTVPDGGRFDGIAGVIAALEVARSLADQGITLEHDLEIADFLAEEVSIFGVSCIGSRGMTGQLPDAWLARQQDGRTLHHDVNGRHGAGKVLLRSAKAGTGIIAGGPMRAVFETLGVHDVVAKSTGSSNPYNMVRATFDALKHQVHPKDIAAQRGLKYATLQARRAASGNSAEE